MMMSALLVQMATRARGWLHRAPVVLVLETDAAVRQFDTGQAEARESRPSRSGSPLPRRRCRPPAFAMTSSGTGRRRRGRCSRGRKAALRLREGAHGVVTRIAAWVSIEHKDGGSTTPRSVAELAPGLRALVRREPAEAIPVRVGTRSVWTHRAGAPGLRMMCCGSRTAKPDAPGVEPGRAVRPARALDVALRHDEFGVSRRVEDGAQLRALERSTRAHTWRTKSWVSWAFFFCNEKPLVAREENAADAPTPSMAPETPE